MRLNQLDVLAFIVKPAAIYIIALELNASFWMLLLAYVLFSLTLVIKFKY